jgi:hypothetical protein
MMGKNEQLPTTGDSVKKGSPSTSNLLETKEEEKIARPPTQPAIGYPSGFTLSLVIIALMLALILVALDMVCYPQSYPSSDK